jgi:hypothetical protein
MQSFHIIKAADMYTQRPLGFKGLDNERYTLIGKMSPLKGFNTFAKQCAL